MLKMVKVVMVAVLSVFVFSVGAFAYPTWEDGVFDISEYQKYIEEDTDKHEYYLDPGYGGQEFDVEYMGLSIIDNTLYFGLQTGLKLEFGEAATTGLARPGDLAFDINNDGNFDFGVQFYAEEIKVVRVYDPNDWDDPICYPVAGPWRVNGDIVAHLYDIDTYGGIAFSGTEDKFENTSYSLEGYINLDMINYNYEDAITAHFTMNCGNDVIDVTAAPVPEPATMFLMGSGLFLLAGRFRKKVFKK